MMQRLVKKGGNEKHAYLIAEKNNLQNIITLLPTYNSIGQLAYIGATVTHGSAPTEYIVIAVGIINSGDDKIQKYTGDLKKLVDFCNTLDHDKNKIKFISENTETKVI